MAPKEKILIADDEPDVLALCARIVRREGYQVVGVTNGQEAIDAAKREHFDLLLTDVMMPGVRGLDAAQTIRKFQPDLVCVAMTGFGTMDTAIQALKLGFSEFVVKPFRPDDLKVHISRALEKDRLRRENARLNALVPLFELNKSMMTTIQVDDLVQKVLRTACDELKADFGVLMLDYEGSLRVKASLGLPEDPLPQDINALVTCTAEELLTVHQPVFMQATEEAEPRSLDLMHRLNVETLLFHPLLAMDKPVGSLILSKSEEGGHFSPSDRELLLVLCGQAAVALQNAGYFEELQHAYQELKKLDHMKSEFTNIAAHELRTPLAILMGHADLLKEEVRDPKINQRLEIIVRNALRLRELIGNLLNMRQLQTGEARVQLTSCDVNDLIADALQDFCPAAEKKSIRMSADVPVDIAPIETDRQKMLITLTNLLLNAIEFTPAGGRVGVDVSDQGDALWVSVWDTGIGIAEEQLDRIFEPFYQVEESLTREHEGMGLGLSITKGMVELCEGKIWVESTLGEGSRFTFALPRR